MKSDLDFGNRPFRGDDRAGSGTAAVVVQGYEVMRESSDIRGMGTARSSGRGLTFGGGNFEFFYFSLLTKEKRVLTM